MADHFSDIEEVYSKKTPDSVSLNPTIESQGSIAKTIGTGTNAKNSIVYLTIKWAFIVGTVLTIFIVLNNWLFRVNEKVPDFTSDVRLIWEIIIPIITLALGYAFGKSEK